MTLATAASKLPIPSCFINGNCTAQKVSLYNPCEPDKTQTRLPSVKTHILRDPSGQDEKESLRFMMAVEIESCL